MSRGAGRGAFVAAIGLFLALAVLLSAGQGCLWGKAAKAPVPFPPDEEGEVTLLDEEAEPEVVPEAPEGPDSVEAPPPAAGQAEGQTQAAEAGAGTPPAVQDAPPAVQDAPAPQREAGEPVPGPASAPPKESAGEAPRAATAEPAPKPRPHAETQPSAVKAHAIAHPDVPAWAARKEVLIYRVEFLGLTMGYARFTSKGKVLIDGREAYHLNVRAWTSDFLSVIYPINDNIEYYLDVKTLAPIRQEFTHIGKGKDDVATFDQEKGRIVYRYKDTGEIRKAVDVPPDVHDPVSAAYYFRARDLGVEERPRHVYGGRKLYEISTRKIGQERIDTPRGPIGTIIIRPIIKRDGQPDNKGDLRMWMTDDGRRIPVRIYAKFRKIKDWTLVAELVQPREGG
ncbi:MAG TPA: DUF3108 domain-containing protein [Candidatus Deferrimicrobiaceae bacterium]